ncbi:MAG: glycosyltransferase family 2 protein [Clostridiales bacterium]|nr:glycosyltransferase family 2 protein [Clostridiales bacterium]
MKFTIAIPTYNNEFTISETIISCLEQDYVGDYEIIISNNNSTDRTEEIIKSFASNNPNIRIIKSNKCESMWKNHNICLSESSGEYVLFCHADDTLEPQALTIIDEKLIERKSPKKYVLWGHSLFNDYKKILDKYNWRVGDYIVGEEAYKIFVGGGLAPSGVCYSRKSFLEMGGFIDDKNYVFPNSDSSTMMKLAFAGFGFEMIENMYLKRTGSSSAFLNIKTKYEVLEDVNHMKILLSDNFSNLQLSQIAYESIKTNYAYAFYISRLENQFKKTVIKDTIKQLLKSPKDVFNRKKRYYLKKIIF